MRCVGKNFEHEESSLRENQFLRGPSESTWFTWRGWLGQKSFYKVGVTWWRHTAGIFLHAGCLRACSTSRLGHLNSRRQRHGTGKGNSLPPGPPLCHPITWKRVYYLREGPATASRPSRIQIQGPWSPGRSSSNQIQVPAPFPTSASSLPAPHFRPLLSLVSPAPRASSKSGSGVKIAQLESRCLHLSLFLCGAALIHLSKNKFYNLC